MMCLFGNAAGAGLRCYLFSPIRRSTGLAQRTIAVVIAATACVAAPFDSSISSAVEPVASARSRSFQTSSLLLVDGYEAAFLFPHRMERRTGIAAFDLQQNESFIVTLANEDHAVGWLSTSGPTFDSFETEQILAFSTGGDVSRFGLSVGFNLDGSVEDRGGPDLEQDRSEFHARVSAGAGQGDEFFEATAGVVFPSFERKLVDERLDEPRYRDELVTDPRFTFAARFGTEFGRRNNFVAMGGFTDRRQELEYERLGLTETGTREVYGHTGFAGVIMNHDRKRGRIFLAVDYAANNLSNVFTREGQEPGVSSFETRIVRTSTGVATQVSRQLRINASVSRVYDYDEQGGGISNYRARWTTRDAFAWGLEYERKNIRLAGLIRTDLSLTEPVLSLDATFHL